MSEDIPKEKEIKASAEVTPKDTPKKKKEITMSGKGDKLRPCSTSQEEFARKWDKAFGRKCCEKSHIPNKETLKSMEKTEKGEGLTEYDDVDELLKDVTERASESITIPEKRDIKKIVKDIKEKSSITLLTDKSLEYQLERMKQGHD